MAVPEADAPKFFRCTDHVAMGRLIKTWATGVDHLQLMGADGKPVSTWPVPSNYGEFERQLRLAQVGPIDADEFRQVVFCKAPDDETLVIPLPTAAQFARGKRFRETAGAWLPAFFDRAYDGPRHPPEAIADDAFAIGRIGEYCISHCC